jgi:hypothetical protein
MAASPVDICNSALIKIGALLISSLSDSTKGARLCNARYNTLRKKLLRGHLWNFAMSRKSLAATVNTPSFEFTNEFLLPSDVLRVIETDLTVGSHWSIEQNTDGNKVLLCNSASVKVFYIKDVTDTTLFPQDFEESLSYLLAADLAFAMTQSRALQRDMFTLYKAEVAEARSFDAQEHSLQEVDADSWIDVRV